MIVIHFTSALKNRGLQERSLLSTKEFAENRRSCVFLSWCAVHRPVSGKQILEMSRFEVFAEDEFSVSHAPEDRGADALLCSCLSRYICALGSVVTAASLVPRCFFAVPSVYGFFSLVLSRGLLHTCRYVPCIPAFVANQMLAGVLVFWQPRVLSNQLEPRIPLLPVTVERDRWKVVNFPGETFDALCFHPSGEQSCVCFGITMKCELLALVRTQVGALDFKRNQRWKPCLAASPRRTRTAVGSAYLTIAAKGSLQLDSAHRLHLLQCGHALHLRQTARGHF